MMNKQIALMTVAVAASSVTALSCPETVPSLCASQDGYCWFSNQACAEGWTKTDCDSRSGEAVWCTNSGPAPTTSSEPTTTAAVTTFEAVTTSEAVTTTAGCTQTETVTDTEYETDNDTIFFFFFPCK